MTRPDPKQVKAMTDVAGVPQDAEVAARIANSIGPAFDGFAPVAGTLPFDLEPASFLARAAREGVEMSGEPALMSLVAVAKAIAAKKLSSREVTQSCLDRIAQWQPRLNAFMAIEADEALAAADAADAALAKGKIAAPLHGVPLAHKDMYYDAGKVVTCGSKIRRDFVADDDLDRAAAAEGRRHGQARLAADGGIRLRPDRPQRALRRGAQSLECRSHHRRLVVGLGLGGRGAADLCGAGLRYRRLDPDAGAFLRRHRLEDHGRPDQPRRRDAAVAVARYRRTAGANGRGLRAAASA